MKASFAATLLLCAGLVLIANADETSALRDSSDHRVIFDRLHPENNPFREDYSALNAIGVLAPVDDAHHRIYAFGSGTLIDSCHVLTAMHVPYGGRGDFDVIPKLGQVVEFLVGQTVASDHNLTEGLKYFRRGSVTARGLTTVQDGRAVDPQRDWAVVTLTENVLGIPPMELLAMEPEDHSKPNWINRANDAVSWAGFPGDHMSKEPMIAHAHLWGSYGQVLGVYNVAEEGYAYFTTNAAGTPGASGGLAFTQVDGRYVGVGIIEGRQGDGIHNLEEAPSMAVLITPRLLDEIHDAQKQSPCPVALTAGSAKSN
jgi:Trypsin-like peptidase domain